MNVLLVGINEKQRTAFEGIELELKPSVISNTEEFEKLLTEYNGPAYTYIAVGPQIKDISSSELAQALRSLFSQSRIVFMTEEKKGYSRTNFIKNGFDETFLLPNDKSIFKKELADFFNFSKNQEKLKPVRLIDIKPGETLDFNIYVYLIKNKKYILYNKANEPTEPDRLKRLIKYHLDVVFVPESQLQNFYKYSAKKLKDIYTEASKIGQTEKLEILQREVRGLFHAIFEDKVTSDFEFGKEVLENCKQIISLLIGGTDKDNWYDRMMSSMSIDSFDPYSHSLQVSIFASLIAMGLGMPNIEDYAIAGLFHDIGLEDNSNLMLTSDISKLQGQEAIDYEKHSEKSLLVLKEKRIILNKQVQLMIEQHHENCLGSGFPNKIDPLKFPIESQILAIANDLDKKTRHELEKERQTPKQALEYHLQQKTFDTVLLKKIIDLFSMKS